MLEEAGYIDELRGRSGLVFGKCSSHQRLKRTTRIIEIGSRAAEAFAPGEQFFHHDRCPVPPLEWIGRIVRYGVLMPGIELMSANMGRDLIEGGT